MFGYTNGDSMISPDKITLTNLYTDTYKNKITSKVYANGVMQMSLFPTINYDTTDELSDADIADVKEYVYNNVIVMEIKDNGSTSPLTWTKSTDDNGFVHDLESALSGIPLFKKLKSDIRTAIYFTVPVGATSQNKLFARLNGQESSKTMPVTVTTQPLSITSADFNISEVAWETDVSLRVLQSIASGFSSLPMAHKLINIDPKGINYKYGGAFTGAYHVMMASNSGHKTGFFLKHDSTGKTAPVYTMGGEYNYYYPDELKLANVTVSDITHFDSDTACLMRLETKNGVWGYPEDLTQSELDKAFSLGLPMLLVTGSEIQMDYLTSLNSGRLNLWLQNFTIHDNFGNVMTIDINWNVGDSGYGEWAVSNVGIVYPS